jgi:aerobic carbon-monoxide dehydrogenase large subunit
MFTIERVVDLVAEALGRDPADVRRLSLIPDEPRPYVSATGARYDTGSFGRQLDEALEAVGYAGFRERQADLRSRGRHVGIGIAVVVEGTAPNLHVVAGRFGGYEMVRLTVQPDGRVSVHSGSKSQGQGHETVLAQVAADVLTIPVDHVTVRDGDTDQVPYGMGTWGSRTAVMAGGAVTKAAHALRAKMTTIAAHMLQVPADEVALHDGAFHAPGASLPFAQVASAAYLHTFLLPPGLDMGLSIVTAYDPGNTSPFPDERGHLNVAATYAGGAAAAVVEVDVSTGRVRVEELVVAHDCGRVINPLIVDGQVQGGCAQGLGAVLLEELPYRADGTPVAVTLAQYHLPRFGDVPVVRALHGETPSPLLGGYRGAGEMGAIVTPAALGNAVHDALRPFGVRIRQTNLVPREVRRLLRAAGVEPDPIAYARGG